MENKDLICPICGEPTYVYFGKPRKDKLCKKHGLMEYNGEIEQCGKCSTWKTTHKPCKCENKKEDDDFPDWLKNSNTTTNNSDELTCIICGENSNGKHFCYNCYKQYKDKSVDIRITNCKEITILDQYGNLTIECDDGRKVRSRAEALISNFFYNNRIRSVYEKTIYYKDNGEDKTLHPDFYLPDFDVYIEYNEIKKKSYLKSKEYTKKIYAKLGFNVIIMDDQDLNSIAGCLKPKLGIN